jgi:Na+-driven multidrug efflux pump
VSGRAILALALPALGTLAADPVLSLVDTAFVGRLGAVPLAALGIDTALFAFAFAVFNFLAYATTPMVAQARGRGDVAGAGLIVRRAMALAVGLGAVSTAFLFLARRASGAADAGCPRGGRPCRGVPQNQGVRGDGAADHHRRQRAYRGFKDTTTPLYVTLAVNGLNIVLDWYFIFGLGLGLEGAALATVAAQWIGALVFVWLLRRVGRREAWPVERIRLADLRPFVAVGGVLVLRTLMLVLALTIAAAAAARIGTVEVAAHQVVAQLWFLLAMIVDALAIAAQALVAELHGAGDRAGARRLSDRLLRWGVGAGVLLGLAVGIGGTPAGPAVHVGSGGAGGDPLGAADRGCHAAVGGVGVRRRRGVPRRAGDRACWRCPPRVGLAAVLVVLALTLAVGWGLVGVWWAMTALMLGRAIVLGAAHYRPTVVKFLTARLREVEREGHAAQIPTPSIVTVWDSPISVDREAADEEPDCRAHHAHVGAGGVGGGTEGGGKSSVRWLAAEGTKANEPNVPTAMAVASNGSVSVQ